MIQNITKIGFTGSQGTGKTTLVHELLKLLPEFRQYQNSHRILNELPNFHLNRKSRATEQSNLAGCCSIQLLNDDKIISDRTLIDHFAYIDTADISIKDGKIIRTTFDSALDYYDCIFYVPIEFEPEDDGTRDADQEYQKMIDERIRYYLNYYNVPFVTLSGTIDERMTTIRETLKI